MDGFAGRRSRPRWFSLASAAALLALLIAGEPARACVVYLSASISGPATVYEGSTVTWTATLTAVSDPAGYFPSPYISGGSFNWTSTGSPLPGSTSGYNESFGSSAPGASLSFDRTFTYNQNGTFQQTLQATATVKSGSPSFSGTDSACATNSITVLNVPPTLTGFALTGNQVRAGAGQTLGATLAATDPGADTVSFTINGAFAGQSLDATPGATRTAGATVGPFAGPRGTEHVLTAQAKDSDNALSNTLQQTVDVVGPQFDTNYGTGGIIDAGTAQWLGDPAITPLDVTNATTDGNLGGLTDLTLLSAVIAGPDASQFELLYFTPGTVLAADEIAHLAIRFTASAIEGVKTATLTFTTDQNAPLGTAGDQFVFGLTGNSALVPFVPNCDPPGPNWEPPAEIPEPSSLAAWLLIGAGGAGYAVRSARRKASGARSTLQ